MHDYYSGIINARTSQCNVMNPTYKSTFADKRSNCAMYPSVNFNGSATSSSAFPNNRNGLDLDFSAGPDMKRSRIVSLSDLALDALSPIYSMAMMESNVSAGSGRPTAATGSVMTPTPTQFLFPQSVTAEQEAYVSGFARALEEIYEKEGRPSSNDSTAEHDASFGINGGTAAAVSSKNVTGVWLPSLNQTSTLHYIPQSSVAVSTAIYGAGASNQSVVANNYTAVATDSMPPFSMGCSTMPVNAVSASVRNSVPIASSGNSSSNLVDINVLGLPISYSSFTQAASLQPGISAASSACAVSRGLDFNVMNSTPIHFPTVSSFSNQAVCYGTLSSASSLSNTELNCSNQQIVTSSTSASPPVTMVNMAEQDHLRLERKRAKNRVAAARCQMRKMERITKLEDKAQDLRNYNAQLSRTASVLRQHVANLRKQILSHTDRGCRLLVPALSQ